MQIVFSGYALIGLTLFLLAATMAVYLARLPTKTSATHTLIGFFAAVALSGLATILSNAIFYWNHLFLPWQDFLVLAGGVALSQFAYHFPHNGRSRETTAVLIVMGSIALAAFVYSVYYTVLFLTNPAQAAEVSDLFYLLLPIGTLLVVLIFLRRSFYYSTLRQKATGRAGAFRGWRYLIYPQGRAALALRNMALALSLAFLPGIQTLAAFPYPYGLILSNIGSLLAISFIALVFLSNSAEVNSFMARLVGITLGAVLLIFSIIGTLDIYHTSLAYSDDRTTAVTTVYNELVRAEHITTPTPVTYVVSWDADRPDDPAQYRLLYRSEGRRPTANFALNKLIQENREGHLDSRWTWSISGFSPPLSNHTWRSVHRFLNYPLGSQLDYQGFIFTDNGRAYEIGFSQLDLAQNISFVVAAWMALLTGCTALILLIFPVFFDTALVQPLQALLAGIHRVNNGDLATAVPIRFNDEIGYLSRSFNHLAQMLKQSQTRQSELLTELQTSHDKLETRVADRIRELSTFAELTRLVGKEETITQTLQPALNRILEAGLCQALCVHVLSEDENNLQLVAHRFLPESALKEVSSIPLSGPFTACVRNPNESLINPHLSKLPAELQIKTLESYLGAPLDVGGRSLGWMSFYRESGNAFQTGEVSLLVAMARQIGVIVENHKLRQRIAEVAVTKERQRLARDLHDSATQLLYSLTLFSRASIDALEEGEWARLQANLEYIENTSLQALRELRALLFELQPNLLRELGLVQTLTNRFDTVERRTGIEVDFQPLFQTLPEEIETAVYFIVTEAMNNVLKHAAATHVSVVIKQTGSTLNMRIVDDGVGFEPVQNARGLGLENMRQRVASLNGTLNIETAPDQGTTVSVLIPVFDLEAFNMANGTPRQVDQE